MSPKLRKTILLALTLISGAGLEAGAQGISLALTPVEHPWSAGAVGGTSFGQGTFRSITENQTHWGVQGGLFASYELNRLISLEAVVQYGRQTQSSLNCCPYWLSEANESYVAPLIDEAGWYYKDLQNRTGWCKLALQANVNLFSLFLAPENSWSLNVSPQISAVSTKTTLNAPDKDVRYGRQMHLGIGGQMSVGYRITESLAASVYCGITTLGGKRFDNIPKGQHKSNLILDAGFKLGFRLGGNGNKARIAAELAAAEEEARANAKREADERERLAERKAAEERAARMEAERLAREEAAKQAAKIAAEMEQLVGTQLPNIYFANNSSTIEESYAVSLGEVLTALEKYPELKLEINAFASGKGSVTYNNMLSWQRMENVRQWFSSNGIALERMEMSFYHGIDAGATSDDMARRVELKYIK